MIRNGLRIRVEAIPCVLVPLLGPTGLFTGSHPLYHETYEKPPMLSSTPGVYFNPLYCVVQWSGHMCKPCFPLQGGREKWGDGQGAQKRRT